MRNFGRLALPFLILALSVAAGLALLGPETAHKGREHSFMNDPGECDTCHVVEWKGAAGTLEDDVFRDSFVDICASCHPERLKRSHPVNVSPYSLIPRLSYPEDLLPLQRNEDGKEDVMTCATCHRPHAPRTDTAKLYGRQKEVPGRPGEYLTYYLRIRGKSPKEGYAPLCKACHPKF